MPPPGRALMGRPGTLLLDEPSMGLAPMIVDTFFRIIGEIRASGATVVLVEQKAAQAFRLADHGYVMENDRIIFADSATNLLTDARSCRVPRRGCRVTGRSAWLVEATTRPLGGR